MYTINDIEYDSIEDIMKDCITSDPISEILNDIGIDINRAAAINHINKSIAEGWTPPYNNYEDNIGGCIEQCFGEPDGKYCLKSLGIELNDILDNPGDYEYLKD
jgi:hypothetical protein